MAQAKAQIDLVANSDQLDKEITKVKGSMTGLGEKMKDVNRFLDRSFTKTFDSATDSVEDFGDAADKAGDKLGGSGGLSGKVTAMSTGFLAVAKAGELVVGVIKSIAGAVAGTVKSMDALGKKSRAMGVSLTELQSLNLGAQLSGVDPTETIRSMTKLSQRVGEAAKGSLMAKNAFEALGLSIDDLSKMNLNERFEAVAGKLNSMSDNTERAAVANQIFEESWQRLGPLLNEGADAMERAAIEQEKMDEFFGELDTTSVEALNDQLTISVAWMKRFSMEAVSGSADIIRAFQKMTGEVTSFNDAWSQVFQEDQEAEQKKFRRQRVQAGMGSDNTPEGIMRAKNAAKKAKNEAQLADFMADRESLGKREKLEARAADKAARIASARDNAAYRETVRRSKEVASAEAWAERIREKGRTEDKKVTLARIDGFQAGFEGLVSMNRRVQASTASTGGNPEERTAKASEDAAATLKSMQKAAETSAGALETLVETYGTAALFS